MLCKFVNKNVRRKSDALTLTILCTKRCTEAGICVYICLWVYKCHMIPGTLVVKSAGEAHWEKRKLLFDEL